MVIQLIAMPTLARCNSAVEKMWFENWFVLISVVNCLASFVLPGRH